MKKLICSIITALIVAASAIAVPVSYNETDPANWSDMSYVQVPVYKILDSKEGYVVIYAKKAYGVGQTIIPKKWALGSKDEPAKLKIRTIGSGKLKPFLTVVKKGGEFHHVILTVHTNKSDSSWGVVGRGVHLDVDKDVLEDLEL